MIPINVQPIEKRVESDGQQLDVHSVFYTIQGEGPFCGHPAVFVRLAGCNLQCPSCDTEYTDKRQMMDIESLAALVLASFPVFGQNFTHKLVVITGGEPFRQNLTPFLKLLIEAEMVPQIETNGTLPPSKKFGTIHPEDVTIVCSPKAGRVNIELQPFIFAYKYVLDHESVNQKDGLPIKALNHTCGPYGVARPHDGFLGPVFLQPMDPKDDPQYALNVQAVKESCLKYGYIFQLQVHKIINVE